MCEEECHMHSTGIASGRACGPGRDDDSATDIELQLSAVVSGVQVRDFSQSDRDALQRLCRLPGPGRGVPAGR